MATCTHCGTEFSPAAAGENFCCRGCEFVHNLIRGEGLDRFYELQDGAIGQPVRDRPFHPGEFGWIEELAATPEATARAADRAATLELRIRGISCVGCVWLIEKLFLRQEGTVRADVFPSSGKIILTWRAGECSLPDFAAALLRFGYQLEPWRSGAANREERDSLVSRIGLCGAFALNSMVFTLPRYLGMGDDFALANIFRLITFISATFSLLVGGSYFFRRAWSALRHRVLHIDLPIALGILLAYTGSLAGWILQSERLLYFDFVALFTFLMLAGRYLHVSAAERIRAQMLSEAPVPSEVPLASGGTKPLEQLAPGDEFCVPPGGVLPVTALLRTKRAEFSLAWITGEPDPVALPAGRRVPAGAVNLNREQVTVRAEQAWADSLVATLAQSSERPHRDRRLEAILRTYLLVVVLLGILGGLAWALASGDPVRGVQVAIAIFVVSCPCALGVALPLADQLATAEMRRRGVFVQNPGLWPRLRHIRRLLLDKTGTLTLEHPRLENPRELAALDGESRAALAHLAASSLHPLSRSLLEALAIPPAAPPPSTLDEVPGLGIYYIHSNYRWSLGRPGWDGRTDSPPESTPNLACDLRRDGTLVARFQFTEAIRPEAREAISSLRAVHRIRPCILSGDAPERVARLAADLGIDRQDARGGLSPVQKAELVRDWDRADTLYLGDGANDSLAFDAAHASGTPVADRSVLDGKADFFFTSRGLGFLPGLFETAKRRSRAVHHVFLFAVLYNLAAVGVCLAGQMSPLLAALLMPLSSLACLALAAWPWRSGPHRLASPAPRNQKAEEGTDPELVAA